jgi:hypothetical protein
MERPTQAELARYGLSVSVIDQDNDGFVHTDGPDGPGLLIYGRDLLTDLRDMMQSVLDADPWDPDGANPWVDADLIDGEVPPREEAERLLEAFSQALAQP